MWYNISMQKFLIKLLLLPIAIITWLGFVIIGLVLYDKGEYAEEITGFWGFYF